MIAISMDDRDTAHRFKESLKAPYHFVADPKAELVKAYEAKTLLLPIAKRITFVVGPKREVLAISEGAEAIDPSGAVAACSIKPPEALKYVTPGKDGGTP